MTQSFHGIKSLSDPGRFTFGSSHQAKNVILLIGDGMGDSEIILARDYTVGANGRLNMDKFPLTGAYTTYAVHADGTRTTSPTPPPAAPGGRPA